MAKINPYIHFNGNAEAAFLFYQSVFGGEFTVLSRFKDIASEDNLIADHEAHKIMHIALPIGDSSFLMGSDVPEVLGQVNENENRSKIMISAASKEEAYHIFNGLSAGGTIEVPMDESPWGTLFGMFRDQFGIEWMIDFNPEK